MTKKIKSQKKDMKNHHIIKSSIRKLIINCIKPYAIDTDK